MNTTIKYSYFYSVSTTDILTNWGRRQIYLNNSIKNNSIFQKIFFEINKNNCIKDIRELKIAFYRKPVNNRITDSNCPISFKDAVKMLLVIKKKINLHYIKEFNILR